MDSLPRDSRLTLYAAVFSLFTALGFIVDVMKGSVNPGPVVLGLAMFTGLTATLFVYAVAYHPRWKLIVCSRWPIVSYTMCAATVRRPTTRHCCSFASASDATSDPGNKSHRRSTTTQTRSVWSASPPALSPAPLPAVRETPDPFQVNLVV